MTKDEALKMAIEALLYGTDHTNAVKACKEALEQPAQEPVGKWESKCKCDFRTKLVGDGCMYCNTEEYIDKLHHDYDDLLEENEQLLTHPHQWQGLTDDEMDKIIEKHKLMWMTTDFARAIEQELKTKNGFSGLKDKNT